MITNLDYLKEMSAGNKTLMVEMIDIFKNQVVDFFSEMNNLYENKEYEKLGRLAHKAKSSISIMGLNDLATELKTFELKAKKGADTNTYPTFINKFKIITDQAVVELDEFVKNIDIYI